MASNFDQPGRILQFTAPTGGVVSGTAYLIGGILAVALVTAAAGVVCNFAVDGVFTLTKVTGTAWTEGEVLYWDNTAKDVTTVSTANFRIGCACRAGGELSASATGMVRLNGLAVTAVAGVAP